MSLYRKYEALSPIYSGGLANHLPMVLNILERWKVDEEQIEEFLDKYVDRYGIYDLSNHVLPITDFEKEYIHLTNYYINEINKDNIKNVVSAFLTDNKLSFSSALFHGIIRLYYSIESDDPLQVAQALAYFNLVSEGYVLSGKMVGLNDIKNEFGKQKEMFEHSGVVLNSTNPTEKFFELLQYEKMREQLVFLQSDEFDKEEILDILLEKYIETEDIYIAHLITGYHAILRLNTYNFQYHETMKQYFLTMQVMFLLVADYRNTEVTFDMSMNELYERRLQLTDPHDIKLFHAVYDLSQDMRNEKLKTVLYLIIRRNEEV